MSADSRLLGKVEGMEIGLSLGLLSSEGGLKLSLSECGCHVKDISIELEGGASWFYQGYAIIYLLSLFSIFFSFEICRILWNLGWLMHLKTKLEQAWRPRFPTNSLKEYQTLIRFYKAFQRRSQ